MHSETGHDSQDLPGYSPTQLDAAKRALRAFLQGGKKDIAAYAPHVAAIGYLMARGDPEILHVFQQGLLTGADMRAIQMHLVGTYKRSTEGSDAAKSYLDQHKHTTSREFDRTPPKFLLLSQVVGSIKRLFGK